MKSEEILVHSPCELDTVHLARSAENGVEPERARLHVILVRPINGGNVGSIARAMANMGIEGHLIIVGSPGILNKEARQFAVHASDRLQKAHYFETLREAISFLGDKPLTLAATARSGSAKRPHPLWVAEALPQAVQSLLLGNCGSLAFVFGPEDDGLSNDEIAECDWIVTIPSHRHYRSLNLAQAALIFFYEADRAMASPQSQHLGNEGKTGQKERLIVHLLQLAEEVGFILPGDPHKMAPRLTQILSGLPNHIEEASTLHGWIDQAIRSARRGEPDFKGRYRHYLESENNPQSLS